MLSIENLRKIFRPAGQAEVRAVDDVNLSVEPGRLLTMLGPSGCGKTTTLRCLAGLERPDSGRIVIGDTVVFDSHKDVFVPASDRGIGMVFQSYAIWPHMSVFENVAFPLRVSRTRKYGAAEIKERVKKALEMVRLSGLEQRSSTRLSGGQQQRLALARTLRITTVYVTHDQAEALALSDEIAVFNAGRVVQRGSPQEIYSRPGSRFF